MAITLTDSWQEVKRRTVTSPNTGLDVTVILYARYDPNNRDASVTRIEQKCTVIFPISFTGTWCNGGGHYQGAYYTYPGSSAHWVWENQGTFQGDGSTTYDDVAFDYWTVECNNGAATVTLGTRWVYPYYGFTAENTEFTVQVELPALVPSGGFISSKVPGTDSVTITGGITNGTANTYVELLLLNHVYDQAGLPHRFESFPNGTLSGTKTISNSSSAGSSGPITISPNNRYYVGVYASITGGSNYRYDGGTVVTIPEAPTVTLTASTHNSATFDYSVSADGGFYDKTLEYSLTEGQTWNTIATISSGSATTGTFTITGLTTGEHTVLVRARTTAGSSSNAAVTWNSAAVRLISSDGTTGREATRVLVPVEDIATEASRLLVSHNGVATENA